MECDEKGLANLNALFKANPALDDFHQKRNSDLLTEQLIRSAFLTPSLTWQAKVIAASGKVSQSENPHYLCDILAGCAVHQRPDFPKLAVARLCSREELGRLPRAIRMSLNQAASENEEFLEALQRVNPSLSGLQQEQQLNELSPGIHEWLSEVGWYKKLLGWSGLKESPKIRTPQRYLTDPIYEFVRAQTIDTPEKKYLKILGKALVHYERGNPQRFSDWRYNSWEPVVERQLRSLDPTSRDWWTASQVMFARTAPVGGSYAVKSGGKSLFLVLMTDEPEVMFNLGSTPLLTPACTSFNNSAYYAKSVVSNTVDAHIKSVIVLDMSEVMGLAKELPRDFREGLKLEVVPSESFLQNKGEGFQVDERMRSTISRYAGELLRTACVRTVVKLVENTQQQPLLLLEPTFVRWNGGKADATKETLGVILECLKCMPFGLALRPLMMSPEEEAQFRLEEVVLPPSRSPGGQLENHDLSPWVATHIGETRILATVLVQPEQQ
jgi:hypothetical protein